MEDIIQGFKTALYAMGIFNWVGVWNNQFERMKNEEGYAIQNPSAFIEIVTTDFHQLGEGVQEIDIQIIIHIISEELDAADGSIDSHLSIYALRDTVVHCIGQNHALLKTMETQDYKHNNLYHYMIQYETRFVDETAKQTYIYTTPPTNVIIIKLPNN